MWSFLDVGVFRSRSCEFHGQCRRVPRGAFLSQGCARYLLPWSHRVIWVVPDGSAELGEMPPSFLAFGSNRVSPQKDGILSSHRFSLNISLICPPPQKPPADPLLLPLRVSHSCDPQTFPLTLKELEIGWVLLPLGNKIVSYCAAQGERNLFLPSVCCNKAFSSSL